MANHSEKHPTLQVSAALGQDLLVRLNAGKLALCAAASTDCLGTTNRETFAADEHVSIRPLHDDGTHRGIAADTIAVGATIYQAANGQIDDAGTVKRGTALTAATAAGDVVIYMPANA